MTNAIRKKIVQFIEKLRVQLTVPLWALANERLIYAVAADKACVWGPKEKVLVKIMKFAYKVKLTDVIIFIVGLTRALSIWFKVKKNARKNTLLMPVKRVFAGFGACSEEYLYKEYMNQSSLASLRICLVMNKGLCRLPCPSFWSVLKKLVHYSFGMTTKIDASILEISTHAVDFLSICALNIGNYTFYREYWKLAKLYGVEEVTFLAAGLPAFACIDEQLPAIYQQHGLMALTILFPDFNKFYISTKDEVNYLRTLFSLNKVFFIPLKFANIQIKSNTLMILSPNISMNERLIEMRSLMQWAIDKNLKIVIRPTIKVSDAECAVIREKYPMAIIDDALTPLKDSFEHWNPKIVASWASTGLATALNYNSIPLSLESEDADNFIWNVMMYPMQHKVLFWPNDMSFLEMALQSEVSFKMQLTRLCNYQDSLLTSVVH